MKQNPSAIGVFYRAVCEDIVEHVGATRASVWKLSAHQDALISVCVHDSRDDSFAGRSVLLVDEFPDYFTAIRNDLRVVAVDALTHPATAAFRASYFAPLDIRSLLDYVVLVDDEPAMVLCCEHCGEMKEWTEQDVTYLHQMASVVALARRASLKAA